MFVCSSCSIRANAAVFASVRISDPPGDLLRPTSQIVAVLLSEIISLAGIDFEIRSYDWPISESSRSRFLLGVDHANRRSLYCSRQYSLQPFPNGITSELPVILP